MVLAGVAALGIGVAAFFALRPLYTFGAIKRKVRRHFPRVEQLQTEELARLLAAGEQVVLVDVRRADEYAVSHLPGARHLDPGAKPPWLEDVDPEARIVAYCSLGWRSSQMAQTLSEAGFRRVANLEGSIFQWAREGRPLARGEQPARSVHPYSPAWAFLVPRALRAYQPDDPTPN